MHSAIKIQSITCYPTNQMENIDIQQISNTLPIWANEMETLALETGNKPGKWEEKQ